MAVIEADKIFDDILKRISYQGEDMGGRAKQVVEIYQRALEDLEAI